MFLLPTITKIEILIVEIVTVVIAMTAGLIVVVTAPAVLARVDQLFTSSDLTTTAGVETAITTSANQIQASQ